MKKEKGCIFIISGPSGCGKSTLLKEVFSKRDNYYFSISATTRAPREGETDGVEYFFLTREEFIKMKENNEFLESAEYVGNFYGTPIAPLISHSENGEDVILDIEVQGNDQARRILPDAVSIFIAPPSLEELERRLRNRSTEGDDKIKKRLARAKEELEFTSTYDYIIVNDDLERAAEELISIMAHEKNKRETA